MEGEPEEDTTHRRQHGHRTVVPHQSRIPRQRYSITAILTISTSAATNVSLTEKSFGDSRRDRSHKHEHRHHD
jgi:hypothetical protein